MEGGLCMVFVPSCSHGRAQLDQPDPRNPVHCLRMHHKEEGWIAPDLRCIATLQALAILSKSRLAIAALPPTVCLPQLPPSELPQLHTCSEAAALLPACPADAPPHQRSPRPAASAGARPLQQRSPLALPSAGAQQEPAPAPHRPCTVRPRTAAAPQTLWQPSGWTAAL